LELLEEIKTLIQATIKEITQLEKIQWIILMMITLVSITLILVTIATKTTEEMIQDLAIVATNMMKDIEIKMTIVITKEKNTKIILIRFLI